MLMCVYCFVPRISLLIKLLHVCICLLVKLLCVCVFKKLLLCVFNDYV